MGLDTVELVVSIEKHFGLEIPDLVCEQLGTVGDVANWLGAAARNQEPAPFKHTRKRGPALSADVFSAFDW